MRIPYILFPANLGLAGWPSYDKVTAVCVESEIRIAGHVMENERPVRSTESRVAVLKKTDSIDHVVCIDWQRLPGLILIVDPSLLSTFTTATSVY